MLELPIGRGGRAVEGARLEIVCGVKLTEGSNPSLSAIISFNINKITGSGPSRVLEAN